MKVTDMPIDPQKYIVFKRDELMNVIGKFMNGGFVNEQEWGHIEEAELKDAVVIRKQDKLAASGLSAYAHTAVTVSEVTDDPGLLEIADYFADQAAEARALTNSRLPE